MIVERIKVLHVVSISFSLKYFIGNQFKHFKDFGVEYSVACSDSQDLRDYSKEMKFEVFPVSVLRKISPISDLRSILQLAKYIRKHNFDLVVAHTPKGGLIGILAAKIAGSPRRIYFRHGLVFETQNGLKKTLLITIEKIVGFLSHKVVNVSASIAEKADLYKLNQKSKNILLGEGSCNGVDICRFKPHVKKTEFTHEIVFGFVGRLCRDKGIVELIEAWRMIQEKCSNVRLLLVGPYDERDILPDDIRVQIDLDNSITHVGHVENAEIFYKKMDVFILPSYREGFPTVVLEASSCGLPIITTKKTGCINAIKEHVTGIYTELTPSDITEKMVYYIENSDKRHEHGKNGRKWMEDKFSEPRIYNEIAKKILWPR